MLNREQTKENAVFIKSVKNLRRRETLLLKQYNQQPFKAQVFVCVSFEGKKAHSQSVAARLPSVPVPVLNAFVRHWMFLRVASSEDCTKMNVSASICMPGTSSNHAFSIPAEPLHYSVRYSPTLLGATKLGS